MTGNASEVRTDDDRYGYKALSDDTKKRLDLNDLLRRSANEKNRNKKVNILIFSVATSAALVFFLLISLWKRSKEFYWLPFARALRARNQQKLTSMRR